MASPGSKQQRAALLHGAWFFGFLLLLALLAPALDNPKGLLSPYFHTLLLDVGINIILAVSLNLILGMAGQFSLGHAGFLAAGAYLATVVAGKPEFLQPLLTFFFNTLHLPMGLALTMVLWTAILAAVALCVLLGIGVGLPTLRLRGDYLAIATLGFGEILAVLITNTPYLGSSTGLQLYSPRTEWITAQQDLAAQAGKDPSLLIQAFASELDRQTYPIGFFPVFAGALLAIALVRNIKYSTTGRALLALREDPIASESVGIPVTRYKVAALAIGAALAGLAGGLLSHHKPLNPESFRFMRSIEMVAMVILGGQGSITGSALAAAGLTILPEALRSSSWLQGMEIEKWRMVLYSLAIILAMLFRPQGLMGRYELSDLLRALGLGRRPGRPEIADMQPQRRPAETLPPLLLEVRNLGMSFGGLRAVDQFNLALAPGELVGLIGPNGAGKTTLFNLLTGVYRPTDGQILVRGQEVTGSSPHRLSAMGVARTFQNIRLFSQLSVLDNTHIAQHAHDTQGIPSALLRTPAYYREESASCQEAWRYLHLFGLEHLAHERAGSLSYGDQRRLEIARALATRPQLLLLDEPAAGMNPTEKRQLMEMIQRIRRDFGLTILLIEHDMKLVMGVCERIVVLDYGRTIASGLPAEIRRHPAVIEAYLGVAPN